MLNFFKKIYKEPKERDLFAITKYRRGDFILFLCKQEDVYEFMRLPDCTQFFITSKEFQEGVLSKLFDFVENIPQDVYDVCLVNVKK